jgi:YidC/Oxa1 family membrane protein insertase
MTPRIRKLLELYDPADVSDVVQHMQDMWSVRMAESALEWIHTTLGLPWWACIVSLTVGLRTAIIPANISLLRNSMRMKLVLPRIAELDAIMRDDKSTPEQREEAAQELQKLFKERDCHPMRNFVIPLGFPPIILSIFLAIHNLTIGEPAMATEGVLWFRDLVEPDPSYLLPILSSVSWLLMVELASGAYYHAWPHVRATARVTSLAFIPLTTTLPAGVFLFWITSNLFAITRTLVLRRDDVRRKLNIPLISDIRDLDHIPAPKP